MRFRDGGAVLKDRDLPITIARRRDPIVKSAVPLEKPDLLDRRIRGKIERDKKSQIFLMIRIGTRACADLILVLVHPIKVFDRRPRRFRRIADRRRLERGAGIGDGFRIRFGRRIRALGSTQARGGNLVRRAGARDDHFQRELRVLARAC